MIQRVCELFMNNILYFCEQLKISIWQQWEKGSGITPIKQSHIFTSTLTLLRPKRKFLCLRGIGSSSQIVRENMNHSTL